MKPKPNWPGREQNLPRIYAYLENLYGPIEYDFMTRAFDCRGKWAYEVNAESFDKVNVIYYINDPKVLTECILKYNSDNIIIKPYSNYDPFYET